MLHHKLSMVHLTICKDSASVVLSLLHICFPCHSLVRTPCDSSNVLTLAQACLQKNTLSHTRTRDIVICLSECEGSLSPPHDSFPDAGEAMNDFGPCQETSYTAITLNQESNFTRREKNHSQFHWNTLTSPELLIQTWMSCKKAASMIVGVSMGQEISLILGQFSLSLLYKVRNVQKEICGPGRD